MTMKIKRTFTYLLTYNILTVAMETTVINTVAVADWSERVPYSELNFGFLGQEDVLQQMCLIC